MFVHAPSRHLLFKGDFEKLRLEVPAIRVDGPGYNVAAKHTAATVKRLRELGHEAPSPIVSYYKWPRFKGKWAPFDHQRSMAEFMTLHDRCFNLGEMGTGKTASVFWALDWLIEEKEVEAVLISAPLSTLERVWADGAFDVLPHRRVQVVHGTREKRLKALATPADIYIVNHDGLSIRPVLEALKKHPRIGLVVVDEGSKLRNAKTDKYRAHEQVLAKKKLRLWWLTGTPTPSGPDDAWAQCRLVNPQAVPKFFGQFRDRVMIEVGEHNWKPKAGHETIVHQAMQPAIRFAKADCLDLPPITTLDLACDMSSEQLAAYKLMANAMRIADHALTKDGRAITASNAADRINKLRQIMLGSVKVGEKEYVNYDYSPRFNVLCEAVEMATAKVLVIVPFKGIAQDVTKKLAKKCSVALVNGDVPIGQRNRIFSDFKMGRDPHALVCHPDVMSHGLNLTEADMLIFLGPMYGNDAYRQVIERYNRPPQTKKLTMVRIGCNAVEWSIYRGLDQTEGQQQLILNLYRNIIGG